MLTNPEHPKIPGYIGWREANVKHWARGEGSQPVEQSLVEGLLETPYARTLSVIEETPDLPGKSFTLNLRDYLGNHKEAVLLAVVLALGVGSLGARIYHDLPYINTLQTASALQASSDASEPESEPPVPDNKPSAKYPSDYLREAYLGLILPTSVGKNVAEIMAESGYIAHSFVYMPEIPDKLRADDKGNYVRRVPINKEGKEFFDKFWIGNIKDSVNAKEGILNIATLAVINPDQSVDFYVVDPRGWVRIATKNWDSVDWHIQEEEVRLELNKAITEFQMPTQTFSRITV